MRVLVEQPESRFVLDGVWKLVVDDSSGFDLVRVEFHRGEDRLFDPATARITILP